MPVGSWIDAGMFIQNILLAAQDFGLASCPQAAFAEYLDVVREVLSLDNVDIICGIAIGHEDACHPLNSYRTKRESIENFTRWYFSTRRLLSQMTEIAFNKPKFFNFF